MDDDSITKDSSGDDSISNAEVETTEDLHAREINQQETRQPESEPVPPGFPLRKELSQNVLKPRETAFASIHNKSEDCLNEPKSETQGELNEAEDMPLQDENETAAFELASGRILKSKSTQSIVNPIDSSSSTATSRSGSEKDLEKEPSSQGLIISAYPITVTLQSKRGSTSRLSSTNDLNSSNTSISKNKRDSKGSKSMASSNMELSSKIPDVISNTPDILTASKTSFQGSSQIKSKPSSKKSSVAASREPSTTDMGPSANMPTSKISLAASTKTSRNTSLAASKEPSTSEIDKKEIKPDSRKSSLMASKNSTFQDSENIDSKPTSQRSSLASTKPPSFQDSEQIESKPISQKSSLAASKEPSLRDLEDAEIDSESRETSFADDATIKSKPNSKKNSLAASKDPSFQEAEPTSNIQVAARATVINPPAPVTKESFSPNGMRKHSASSIKGPKVGAIKPNSKKSSFNAKPPNASQPVSKISSRVTSKAPSFNTIEIIKGPIPTHAGFEFNMQESIPEPLSESAIIRESIREISADATKIALQPRFSRTSLSSQPLLDTIPDTPQKETYGIQNGSQIVSFSEEAEEGLNLMSRIDLEFKEAQQADSAKPKKVVWFKCFLRGESRILVLDQHSRFVEFRDQARDLFLADITDGGDGLEMSMFYLDIDGGECRLDGSNSFDAAISTSNKLNRPFVSVFCSVTDSEGGEVLDIPMLNSKRAESRERLYECLQSREASDLDAFQYDNEDEFTVHHVKKPVRHVPEQKVTKRRSFIRAAHHTESYDVGNGWNKSVLISRDDVSLRISQLEKEADEISEHRTSMAEVNAEIKYLYDTHLELEAAENAKPSERVFKVKPNPYIYLAKKPRRVDADALPPGVRPIDSRDVGRGWNSSIRIIRKVAEKKSVFNHQLERDALRTFGMRKPVKNLADRRILNILREHARLKGTAAECFSPDDVAQEEEDERERQAQILLSNVKKQLAAHRRNVEAMAVNEETQTSLQNTNTGNSRIEIITATEFSEVSTTPPQPSRGLRLGQHTFSTIPESQRAVSFEVDTEPQSPMLMSAPQDIFKTTDSLELECTDSMYQTGYSEAATTPGAAITPGIMMPKPALKYGIKPAQTIRSRVVKQNNIPTRAKMVLKGAKEEKTILDEQIRIKGLMKKTETKPLNYSSALMEDSQLVPLIDHLAHWKMKAMYADAILASQKMNAGFVPQPQRPVQHQPVAKTNSYAKSKSYAGQKPQQMIYPPHNYVAQNYPQQSYAGHNYAPQNNRPQNFAPQSHALQKYPSQNQMYPPQYYQMYQQPAMIQPVPTKKRRSYEDLNKKRHQMDNEAAQFYYAQQQLSHQMPMMYPPYMAQEGYGGQARNMMMYGGGPAVRPRETRTDRLAQPKINYEPSEPMDKHNNKTTNRVRSSGRVFF